MLAQYKLSDILFIDIETVPVTHSFENLSESMQDLWEKKSQYFRKPDETAIDIFQRAGIYAEFGKIICISVGVITKENSFKTKSFAGDNETELLIEFAEMITKWDASGNKTLCGHNIKEFDIPYICRRMLINDIKLPNTINLAGKKPWEVKHIDTLELWKFGDYKHFTSLALLAEIFNIPTPKDDIDGSQVSNVYYEEKDLDRIVKYCEKDILCVANLFLRLQGKPLIDNNNLEL